MSLETPLTNLHRGLGAKMVPFAGYTMPISYPDGIIAEHHHTRSKAGLFDVSHMGQVMVTGRDIARLLEQVMPADLSKLEPMKSTYALLTNDVGGVRDDLIVTKLDEEQFFLVLNAANKHDDLAYLRETLPELNFELMDDKALLALQGPDARKVLARFADDVDSLAFMSARHCHLKGIGCFVTCSGYTGEDGFEISVDGASATRLAELLLLEAEVAPIGLGARDSLRLEVGLCLHGHELSEEITPIEARLKWAIAPSRREGGERAGGYPGADVLDQQMRDGAQRVRVGLKVLGRRPVRAGQVLLNQEGDEVGSICSDAFGASVGGPIAMAYLHPSASVKGSVLRADLRGKFVELEVVALPMLPQRYFRAG
jgi:aminomethyltransferase